MYVYIIYIISCKQMQNISKQEKAARANAAFAERTKASERERICREASVCGSLLVR
jgi:hypothetical protein